MYNMQNELWSNTEKFLRFLYIQRICSASGRKLPEQIVTIQYNAIPEVHYSRGEYGTVLKSLLIAYLIMNHIDKNSREK